MVPGFLSLAIMATHQYRDRVVLPRAPSGDPRLTERIPNTRVDAHLLRVMESFPLPSIRTDHTPVECSTTHSGWVDILRRAGPLAVVLDISLGHQGFQVGRLGTDRILPATDTAHILTRAMACMMPGTMLCSRPAQAAMVVTIQRGIATIAMHPIGNADHPLATFPLTWAQTVMKSQWPPTTGRLRERTDHTTTRRTRSPMPVALIMYI